MTANAAFRAQDWSELDAILDRLADEERWDLLLDLIGSLRLSRPAIARLLMSEADIDDAEQATLVKLHAKLATFDGRSRLRTWLHTVATNEARMLIRHQASRPSPTPTDPGTWFGAAVYQSSIIADRLDLARAVDGLDEPYRSAVLLRDLEGLDYAEIAKRLGCAVGTVSSRVARGRAMLVVGLGRRSSGS